MAYGNRAFLYNLNMVVIGVQDGTNTGRSRMNGLTFLAEHPELAQSGFGVESPRQRQLVITYGLARRHRWDEVTYA